MYRIRDFIETRDGLIFSVVSNLHPSHGILSNLRFARKPDGLIKFSSTRDAQKYLSATRPEFFKFCRELDTTLPVVPTDSISRHFQPQRGLAKILSEGKHPEVKAITSALVSSSGIGQGELGITGSYLVGTQSKSSDIDLVIYGLDNYLQIKRALQECIEGGVFSPLDPDDWRAIYRKRAIDPEFYSFEEFLWHESRKLNRAKFESRIFDILSGKKIGEITGSFSDYSYRRLGEVEMRCTVTNSETAHDYPAKYRVSDCDLKNVEIQEVVSFTHTYVEQAQKGEEIVCRGILEEVSGRENYLRVLVGSSREAHGEFVKVQGAQIQT